MVAEMVMNGNLQIQLLKCNSPMSDCKGLVNKFYCKNWSGSIERFCLFDASSFSFRSSTGNIIGGLPGVGALTNCLGNNVKWQVAGQRCQLRMRDHCSSNDLLYHSRAVDTLADPINHTNALKPSINKTVCTVVLTYHFRTT